MYNNNIKGGALLRQQQQKQGKEQREKDEKRESEIWNLETDIFSRSDIHIVRTEPL